MISVCRIHRFIFLCFMCFIILISNKKNLKSDNNLNDKIVTENYINNYDKTRIIKDVIFINGCHITLDKEDLLKYSMKPKEIYKIFK